MSSVNKVILLGHVGKNPIITPTKSDIKRASFSVATSEYRKDKLTSEKKQAVQWHNIITFHESTVNYIQQYVFAGAQVFVEGCLQYREHTTAEGKKVNITEIVISPFKGQIQLIKSSENKVTIDEDDPWGTEYTM